MTGSMPSNTHLPPWERENIAQVPFVDSTSPVLSNAEREALPSLWAARSNTLSRPNIDVSTRIQETSAYRAPRYSDEHGDACRVKTPLTAPPLPAPYETPVYIPPAPRTEPHPPTFIKAPPTPPDSESWSETNTSTHSSPHCQQTPPTLPGTMTSRTVERKSSSRTDASYPSRESRRRLSRMQRWRSAVKVFFVSQNDEDSDFEHIEARHWTDE